MSEKAGRPVCEAIVPKRIGIASQELAERKTVEKIAVIMHTVTFNVDELRKYMRMNYPLSSPSEKEREMFQATVPA